MVGLGNVAKRHDYIRLLWNGNTKDEKDARAFFASFWNLSLILPTDALLPSKPFPA